jgi:hypothetical protein
MEKRLISAVTGNGAVANIVHCIVLIIASGMLASVIYTYKPLYHLLIDDSRWEGVVYLVLVCILIPVYWPSLVYRVIIILMLPFSGLIKKHEYKLIERNRLPPFSIIIAVRNEPASIVITLLSSLVKL